jgi:NitT/TauT family transport system substrate-binding protein
MKKDNRHAFTRRDILRAAGIAALAAPLGILGSRVASAGAPKELKLAWNANAVCLAPVAVGVHRGIFEKHGLKVELINFAGSTDQLLEAIATGKADAGVGLIHRWIKPLEQGFDVKLVGSSHGGCLRLVGSPTAGVTALDKLRGKTIGVSDMSSPGKNFFAIYLSKNGIDPDKDVSWRVYPANLLGVAVEKGEIQAIADGDPNLYVVQKKTTGLVDIASNLSGEYRDKLCCVLGVRGTLVRSDKPTAAALTRAVVEASDYVANNPNDAAQVFSQYSPVAVADLRAVLGTLRHGHHPVGGDLKREVEFFARDFRSVGILKQTTDPVKFSEFVSVDVLA